MLIRFFISNRRSSSLFRMMWSSFQNKFPQFALDYGWLNEHSITLRPLFIQAAVSFVFKSVKLIIEANVASFLLFHNITSLVVANINKIMVCEKK